MEVGDDVRHAGGGVAHHLTPDGDVPAGQPLAERHRDEPGAGVPHQLEDVGVGRGVDGHPLAGARTQPADRGDGAHRPRGDHDLFGHGGDAAGGVAVREGLAQDGEARRVVAVGVGVERQVGHGALDGAGQPGLGGRKGGTAEVDHRAGGLRRQRLQAAGGQGVPRRDGGPTSGAAPGLQEPFGAQGFVGGGDGGAADPERGGQLALRGQPGRDRHPALQDEQAYAVGEAAVGGQPPPAAEGFDVPRVLRPEQPGELGRAYR